MKYLINTKSKEFGVNVDLEVLAKNFDLILDAPNSVPKLREYILQLAVQGKLVPQDPNDEPASELLKKIKAEKDKLIAEGKIKKEKPLEPIKAEDIPFEIPTSWEWVRLGTISIKLTDGSHNPPSDYGTGIPMLSSQNINNNKIDFLNPSRYVSEEDFISENKRTQAKSGDVLLTIVGSLGRSAVVPETAPKFVLQRSVSIISSPISSYFLCKALSSSLCTNYYETHGKGTAQKGIYLGQLSEMPIIIPPLEEQKRIVERVEQLMKYCDELEEKQKEVQEKRINFNLSATHHLTNSDNKEDFNKYLQLINDNFDFLYDEPKNVKQLRETILQLAVQGKLVSQDPNDEPASELLKKIKAEKDKLIKEGKIKKEELSSTEIDKPYSIPENWIWTNLQSIGLLQRGKSKHRPRNDQILFDNGIYPLIQTGDVSKAKNSKYKITTLTSFYNDFGLLQSKIWEKGTLCITIAANIAESGFLTFDACFPDSIVGFTSLNNTIISEYVNYFIIISKNNLEKFAPSTAQKNINLGILSELLFPLPPLEEQKRIVSRVEQLMKYCDELEANIEKYNKDRQALMASVLSSSLKSKTKELSLV